MPDNRFIQVIVPLKLSWDPVYRVPDGLKVQVGTRVKVRISGKLVGAVVSAVDVCPDIDERRILDVTEVCEGLEAITAQEIALWRFIADYYMCTVGEVYKCAYPSAKVQSEEIASRIRERAALSKKKMMQSLQNRIGHLESEMQQLEEKYSSALSSLSERSVKTREKLTANRDARRAKLEAQIAIAKDSLEKISIAVTSAPEAQTDVVKTATEDAGKLLSIDKPLLLKASQASRFLIYRELVKDVLDSGRNVLMLVPDISLTAEYEAGLQSAFGNDKVLVFHSRETTVCRRKIAEAMRGDGEAKLVVGTRSALFLPFFKLGLVIVDEEQDRSFKQDSPAPRYNARDCAVMLAKIHSVPVVLGSASPSLESEYNCMKERYARLDRSTPTCPGDMLDIVDIPAEKRKRGMLGQYSRRLLTALDSAVASGRKVYLIRGWGDTTAAAEELLGLRPDLNVVQFSDGEEGQVSIATLAQTRYMLFEPGSVVALLQADPILGARDFRADERALHIFERYRQNNPDGTFIIQTARADHPIFKALQEGTSPYYALLSDRNAFGYPPFSRIVDINLCDMRQTRLSAMSSALVKHLYACIAPQPGLGGSFQILGPSGSAESGNITIRVIIRRDAQFTQRKKALRSAIESFASERAYSAFIHMDVDPD